MVLWPRRHSTSDYKKGECSNQYSLCVSATKVGKKKWFSLDRQCKIQCLAVIMTFDKLYKTLILDSAGAKKEIDLVSSMIENEQLVQSAPKVLNRRNQQTKPKQRRKFYADMWMTRRCSQAYSAYKQLYIARQWRFFSKRQE
jgi:hypothetical protein